MSAPYFVAPDGSNEPTIWRQRRYDREPIALIRLCEIPEPHRDEVWTALMLGFNPEVQP